GGALGRAGGLGGTAGAAKTRADRQRAKREPASQKKTRPRPDLTIVQTQVFRGPNYWSFEPCIRMLVDLGSLEEWPSNTIPGFTRKLLELLPGVGEHSCSLGKRGGFRERLEDGTWLGHVAEHVALELQRESGAQISRGKTRSAGAKGRYNVIYGYAEELGVVETVEAINKKSTEAMTTAVDEIEAEVFQHCKMDDEGRVNELKTAIKFKINGLANRMERGFSFEVRTTLPPKPDPKVAQMGEMVAALAARGVSGRR
ncbi:MAG: hypothetical protein WD971_11395, partial [Pirellulales bacterium]